MASTRLLWVRKMLSPSLVVVFLKGRSDFISCAATRYGLHCRCSATQNLVLSVLCTAQVAARPDPHEEASRRKRRRFEVPVTRNDRPVQPPPAHHLPPAASGLNVLSHSVSGAALSAVLEAFGDAHVTPGEGWSASSTSPHVTMPSRLPPMQSFAVIQPSANCCYCLI